MVKNNQGSSVVGLVNGSMAVAKQAAKVKNVIRRRCFLESVAKAKTLQQALSQTQTPYRVGSQFDSTTLLFSATELSANAKVWIQSHDKYRITKVEVFANYTVITESSDGRTLLPAFDPVEVYFYEDTDADPGTATSWIRTHDRDNVGRVVLTPQNPSQRLITFKPTLTFAAAAGVEESPSNVLPNKNQWLETSNSGDTR